MIGARFPVRVLVVSLLMAGVSARQEPELERAKTEAARLREAPPSSWLPSEPDYRKELQAIRDRTAGLHAALKDWAESLLPASKAALDAEVPFLNARLKGGLQRAGLLGSGQITLDVDDFKPGFATRVDVLRPPEDPDKLALSVGAASQRRERRGLHLRLQRRCAAPCIGSPRRQR